MQTQENMRAYIEKTRIGSRLRNTLYISDMEVIEEMIINGKMFEAILLSFEYGRAKGYRLAKSELRHG